MPGMPAHPVIGVSTAVLRGAEILLVKRGKPPFLWAFPGGHLEFGETLAAAAAREVREEAGIEVEVGEAIDRAEIFVREADGRLARHYVVIVFAGRHISGDLRAGDDATDARWVTAATAGNHEMTPDTRRIVARLLA